MFVFFVIAMIRMIVFYLGTAEDNFAYHNNTKFSASDQDNDDSDRHCEKEYSCGWWFRSCFRVNLNGKYTPPTSFSWKGLIKGNDKHHPLKSSSMKIRSVSSKCNFGDSITAWIEHKIFHWFIFGFQICYLPSTTSQIMPPLHILIKVVLRTFLLLT